MRPGRCRSFDTSVLGGGDRVLGGNSERVGALLDAIGVVRRQKRTSGLLKLDSFLGPKGLVFLPEVRFKEG